MGKVRFHSIDKKVRYQIIGDFYDIVANLKSKGDVINFFVGIFTPSEAIMMARRIQIAKRLLDKKSYQEIQRELKVGSQTITKTDRWLHSRGDEYALWLGKCLKRSGSQSNSRTAGHPGDGLLDKYAQHRIMKNIFG